MPGYLWVGLHGSRQAYKHGYKIKETFDRFENRTIVSLDSGHPRRP
jgi:hypothetical protein